MSHERYLAKIARLGYPAETVAKFRQELESGDPDRLEDYREYLLVKLDRVLKHLDEDELEFLRDEFVRAAMTDYLHPQDDDVECYDFADLIQDEIEIRKYGRTVTGRAD